MKLNEFIFDEMPDMKTLINTLKRVWKIQEEDINIQIKIEDSKYIIKVEVKEDIVDGIPF
jgi:hypothetical protein|nr:MAG TPA: hypothetical protein [Caudoviricetes sp.]